MYDIVIREVRSSKERICAISSTGSSNIIVIAGCISCLQQDIPLVVTLKVVSRSQTTKSTLSFFDEMRTIT